MDTTTRTARLIALCPSPLAPAACVPAINADLVKAEIETFNNAQFEGRTRTTINKATVRGFAFRGTAGVAGGVARVFGRSVYRLTGGAASTDGCYFIVRDSDLGLTA